MSRALITGVTGQDGSYLAQLLLQQGYEITGCYRAGKPPDIWRLQRLGIEDLVRLVPLDLLDGEDVLRVVDEAAPDEIYNLAAQSFVGRSFAEPEYTGDADALAVTRMLEAVRRVNPGIKYFQASSAEMFGRVRQEPQDEATPFAPANPYGVAKLYAHWMTVVYREAHGFYAVSGILYNHESPLRGQDFVTRKITLGLARIFHGEQEVLALGNLDARKDWGYAGDYVRAMWLSLQRGVADDYVVATGRTHSVRDFAAEAARAAGLVLEWKGEGVDEVAIDSHSGRVVIRIDPALYRPAEPGHLCGDAGKCTRELGWRPEVGFEALVGDMVQADLRQAESEARPARA